MKPSKPPQFASRLPQEVPFMPLECHDSTPGDPVTGEVCLWCGRLLRVSEGVGICTQCRRDADRIALQMIKTYEPQSVIRT